MRASIALYMALYASLAQGGCTEALEACDSVINAQETQIQHLKEDVAKLKELAAEANRAPLVPVWFMFVSSLATLGAGAAFSVPALLALGSGMGVGTLATGLKE